MKKINLNSYNPLSLAAGEIVSVSGTVFTARDAVHKLMFEAVTKGLPLPFDIKGAAIYYCGPSPARAGDIIGSCGPTSSVRMDAFTPALLDAGLKTMIDLPVPRAILGDMRSFIDPEAKAV